MRNNSNVPVPKLSVLLAVNKIDAYLQLAINSILAQTYRDFEFLIICNGSKRYEIEEFINNNYSDTRIAVKCLSLEGLTFALNYGIEIAKGAYIARHDGDDVSFQTRFEKQLFFLESNPEYGVVGCIVQMIDENGSILPDKFLFRESHESITNLLPIYNSLCHPALMFRRDALIKVNGYLYGYFSEDHDLFIRLAHNTIYKFKNLPEILFQYRRHNNQLTAQNLTKVFSEVSAIHFINIFQRKRYKSLLGIIWVLPQVILFKRFIRRCLRKYK